MESDRHPARRARLLHSLKSGNLPVLLVTDETNVSYLTGFTGDSSYLLIGPGVCLLISDGRYTTQIREECPGLDVHIRPPSRAIGAATAGVLRKAGIRKLAIEAESLSVAGAATLTTAVKGLQLQPASGLVEELRAIKDAGEIHEIREAIHLAERGFAVLKAELRGELTELAVAHNLEHAMRGFGARGCSFPPIIAVGRRAALPHARPGLERIGSSDFVLVDWGATGPGGYHSDLTRVIATGSISPKLERVYGVVLKAQLAAIRAIRPGVRGCDVDAVARRVIQEAGFGKRFTHSLGHGIGLAVHESPRLSAASDAPLRVGMIVTVEPGIYIEGWGGVRIEDDVLVTRSGCEVLTSVPKDLAHIAVH